MYGAILGDIVGSPYEFDCNNYKAKDFPLFSRRSDFTDDTVMTLAVAKALLSTRGQDDAAIKAALVREMQQLGRAYPDRGYGTHFGGWLYEDDPQPYQSYGNGSAMRVSSAAWLAKDMAESLHLAQLTAEVTHDHPEGIKGAQAVAAAIFLARTGHDKAEIKAYVEREFDYDLSRSCDEIRPTYHHVESCQETVPQATINIVHPKSAELRIRQLFPNLSDHRHSTTAIFQPFALMLHNCINAGNGKRSFGQIINGYKPFSIHYIALIFDMIAFI